MLLLVNVTNSMVLQVLQAVYYEFVLFTGHRAAGENNSSSDDSASYGSDIDEDVAERSKQGVPSFLQHEGTISYNQPTKGEVCE